MPALEARLSRFYAAHVQPVGISVDSVHSHANWARSLGGISFPLLSDFHPKGAVAEGLGVYLSELGFTARATVLIDADGVVQFAEQVRSGRDMDALVERCEQLDAAHAGTLPDRPSAPGLTSGAQLFVKDSCGFSRAALLARENLHLEGAVATHNVSHDEAAKQKLVTLTGKLQAPCLVVDGKSILESEDIIATLVAAAAPL